MTVHAYSNSPTVLAGIIDSKDNLERFPAAFLKALVWSFTQAGARLDGEPPVLMYGIGQHDKAAAEALFPRKFAEHLENNSLCPPIVGGDAQKYAGQRLGELVSTAFALAQAHRPQRPSDIHGMFCSAASGKRGSGCNDPGIPVAFREIVVRSYQMGFKLIFDAAAYLISDLENVEEVAAVLEEMDNNWHIGAIEDPEWNQKMLTGTPKLFTVGTDSGSVVDQGEGGGGGSETFTARILEALLAQHRVIRTKPPQLRHEIRLTGVVAGVLHTPVVNSGGEELFAERQQPLAGLPCEARGELMVVLGGFGSADLDRHQASFLYLIRCG